MNKVDRIKIENLSKKLEAHQQTLQSLQSALVEMGETLKTHQKLFEQLLATAKAELGLEEPVCQHSQIS